MNTDTRSGGGRERAREAVLAGVRGSPDISAKPGLAVSDDDNRRVLAVLAHLDRDR